MAMQILPLPFPLGLDKSTIIHQPIRLHIKPGNLHNPTLITDDWGREIVSWSKSSYSLSKRRTFFTPDGRHLYDLRAHGSSVLQGCILGGAKGWRFESGGKEIGWIEPDSINQRASYELGFVNSAGAGENFQLRMRGSLSDGSSALMLGNIPVILFHRQMVRTLDWYTSYDRPAATYTALIAPGCDLVWVASLISALEVAYTDVR